MKIKIANLNAREKQTFRLHLIYSFVEGIIMGVLAMNEFVLIKSLQGSNYQIGVLFQLSVVLMVLSIVFNEWIKRTQKKVLLIRLVGVATRLPLLVFLFFPRSLEGINEAPGFQILFLLIFLVFYLSTPVLLPTINLFLKKNYRHDNFGPLYAYSTTLNKVVMLVSTFAFGWLLDKDPYCFTYVYPALAVLGMVSIVLFTRIPFTSSEVIVKTGIIESLKSSVVSIWSIIKGDKPYRDFEIGFMLYGFAWMTTIAVITIFFDKALHLNYSSVAFYKTSYNLIAILILPFFGRLINKIDPRKFGVVTFASLLLYLFFLALTEYFPQHVEVFGIKIYFMLIPAFLSHAVFAATMSLLWFIGSAYFSKDDNAANYQSVHLTLTGVRGLFAPLLGVFFFEALGFSWTFGIAILSLAIAIILMFWSIKNRTIRSK
ncbi:MAG: MFS transporter [Bacteroidales bacterium]|nr:MFS transporter [Bacteroidales bacterium]